MIDPIGHFVVILITFVIAALTRHRWNAGLLTAAGMVFVFILSPIASMFIGLLCIEAALLVFLLKGRARSDPWRKYLPYILLPNFLFVDFHFAILGFNIQTLAISFSTIRVFMTAKSMLTSRTAIKPQDYPWIFVAGFFLPALIIGPVFSGTAIRDSMRKGEVAEVSLRNHRLLLQGLILALLVSPAIVLLFEIIDVTGPLLMPVIMVLRFLNLFATFWGQSLIAEESARFFGFSLPQNFDKPWLATNIRDFWARWHRSMAQFVMQYIYLPLTLKSVPNRAATISAFLFMGLWHNTSLGYAIWGLCHGVLLAFWPVSDKGNYRFVKRVFLWTAVIGLSYVANYAGL